MERCIDQANPDDKHDQIGQMGRIYSEAQLTLIAAAGKDPTYGLAGVSKDHQSTSACEALGDLGTIVTYPYSTANH
jgi:hypothetical protein